MVEYMFLAMLSRHFVTLIVIILFTVNLLNRRSFKSSGANFFWIMIVSCFVLIIEDIAETFASLYPAMRFWRIFWTATGYTFRSFAALGLLLVVVSPKDRKPYLGIPALVSLILSFTGFFTDIVFGFNEDYEFYRGPCGYVVFAMPIVYLLLIVWVTVKDIIDKKGLGIFIVLLCVLFCLGATAIDATYGGVHLNEAIMISSLFLYLFLYSKDNRSDSLTGLLNRQAYYDDSASYARSIKAVASLDMNGLKELNDTQGHEAGDQALCTIGKCIMDNASDDTYAYRTGGDEFILLFFTGKEDLIRDRLDKIKSEVADKGYSVSAGYSLIDDKTDLNAAVIRSDKKMYQDKSDYYRRAGIDRRRRS